MSDRSRVSIVLAADAGGGIGHNGTLPWHMPADLRFFKRTTRGHPVVMGRRTHDAVGRALPGRTNVVVTRDPAYTPAGGCVTARTLADALHRAAEAEGGEDVMVIGGAGVMAQALPHADRLVLTRIHARFPADTHLPEIAWDQWRETWRADHEADDANPYPYSFVIHERR